LVNNFEEGLIPIFTKLEGPKTYLTKKNRLGGG